jgi:hypothetical protein
MDWSELWADTSTAGNFWQSVSAVSAIVTVVAVLFLPVISQKLRQQNILSMIQKELSEITLLMRQIVECGEKRKAITDGSTGITEVMTIEAIAKRVSHECWDNFRFELSQDAYRCLKPFFISASDVQSPQNAVASTNPETPDMFHMADLRQNFARDFLDELSKTAKKCKYLKI